MVFVVVVVEHAPQAGGGALGAPLPEQVAHRARLRRDRGHRIGRWELVRHDEAAELRHPERVGLGHLGHAVRDRPWLGRRSVRLPLPVSRLGSETRLRRGEHAQLGGRRFSGR